MKNVAFDADDALIISSNPLCAIMVFHNLLRCAVTDVLTIFPHCEGDALVVRIEYGDATSLTYPHCMVSRSQQCLDIVIDKLRVVVDAKNRNWFPNFIYSNSVAVVGKPQFTVIAPCDRSDAGLEKVIWKSGESRDFAIE